MTERENLTPEVYVHKLRTEPEFAAGENEVFVRLVRRRCMENWAMELDPRLEVAMRANPRHLFLPEDAPLGDWGIIYQDMPVGYDEVRHSTISQPSLVMRIMMEVLHQADKEEAEGLRVFEMGCGTGWVVAMLASMEEVGMAEGVEIDERLAGFGQELLADNSKVKVVAGNGFEYLSKREGEYDAVIVSAELNQRFGLMRIMGGLRVGGRAVLPLTRALAVQLGVVNESYFKHTGEFQSILVTLERTGEGNKDWVVVGKHGAVRFVELKRQ